MNISTYNKVLFYLSYFFYKFVWIWFEVKKNKYRLFLIEFFYSFGKFYKPLEAYSYKIPINYLETVLGKFYLRPNTMDIISASPAFERDDINYLKNLLNLFKKEKKNILFIDAGSDFGYYSVVVGNHLKDYRKLSIHSFEPVPDSFQLLKKNISINKLDKKTTTYNFALLDQNKDVFMKISKSRPGENMIVKTLSKEDKIKAKAKTLDSLRLYKKGYDVLVIKIDVQGVETELMSGALETLNNIDEVYILIEDWYQMKIINFLKKNKFTPIKKITPYNSWWKI